MYREAICSAAARELTPYLLQQLQRQGRVGPVHRCHSDLLLHEPHCVTQGKRAAKPESPGVALHKRTHAPSSEAANWHGIEVPTFFV